MSPTGHARTVAITSANIKTKITMNDQLKWAYFMLAALVMTACVAAYHLVTRGLSDWQCVFILPVSIVLIGLRIKEIIDIENDI